MAHFSKDALKAAQHIHSVGGILAPAFAKALGVKPHSVHQPGTTALVSECPSCTMDYPVIAGTPVMCQRCGDWVATVERGAE